MYICKCGSFISQIIFIFIFVLTLTFLATCKNYRSFLRLFVYAHKHWSQSIRAKLIPSSTFFFETQVRMLVLFMWRARKNVKNFLNSFKQKNMRNTETKARLSKQRNKYAKWKNTRNNCNLKRLTNFSFHLGTHSTDK